MTSIIGNTSGLFPVQGGANGAQKPEDALGFEQASGLSTEIEGGAETTVAFTLAGADVTSGGSIRYSGGNLVGSDQSLWKDARFG